MEDFENQDFIKTKEAIVQMPQTKLRDLYLNRIEHLLVTPTNSFDPTWEMMEK